MDSNEKKNQIADDCGCGCESTECSYPDFKPSSFLRQGGDSNKDFNSVNSCEFSNIQGYLKKPIIPGKCNLKWKIGKSFARGTGAVLFYVNDIACKSNAAAARISKLRNEEDTKKFRRDVEARYILSCQCKTIRITNIIDAFICKKNKNEKFGVSISDLYFGDAIEYVKSLPSRALMERFLTQLDTQLRVLVASMHKCSIAHRDMHAGNVLVRNSPDLEIVLTDFESAVGTYWGHDDQVISAYKNSDRIGVEDIVSELQKIIDCLCGPDDVELCLKNLESDSGITD